MTVPTMFLQYHLKKVNLLKAVLNLNMYTRELLFANSQKFSLDDVVVNDASMKWNVDNLNGESRTRRQKEKINKKFHLSNF